MAAPRKTRPPQRPTKAAPSARTLTPSSGTVTLEEVLIGFQRSLARATRSSLETARGDWQVGMGQRSLYVVDSIAVTLQAGVSASMDAAGQVQTLALDLGRTPADGASTLAFRVLARPIEAIASERLVLADTDPLGHLRPRHGMRLTLIGHHDGSAGAATRSVRLPEPSGAKGRQAANGDEGEADGAESVAAAPTWVPLPHVELTLHVTGGDSGHTEIFRHPTNLVGQLEVVVDAAANSINLGGRVERFRQLDLRTQDDDFFVYASCTAPAGAEHPAARLTSNVIQFWVQRDAAPPARTRKAGR